jgi:sRNA-binding protein
MVGRPILSLKKPIQPPKLKRKAERPDQHQIEEAKAAIRAAFPLAFVKPRRPLAIGVREQVLRALPNVDPQAVKVALGRWVQSRDYQEGVLRKGARRIALDGSDAGPITDAERLAAKAALKKMEEKLA